VCATAYLSHCLQPQPASSDPATKVYGPYRVIEVINVVAVRLDLPLAARIPDVFHMGLLKKFHGQLPAVPPYALFDVCVSSSIHVCWNGMECNSV
jgi:hypothetical protein